MKRNPKASALSRQKPKKKRKQSKKLSLFTWRYSKKAFLILLVPLAAIMIFWINPKLPHKNLALPAFKERPWKISVKLESKNPLSEHKLETILATAQRLIGTGSREELSVIANSIQKSDSFRSVIVLNTAPHEIVIAVEPRQPVLCLDLGSRLRLIDQSGEVYGLAGIEGQPNCPGPRLIVTQKEAKTMGYPASDPAIKGTILESIRLHEDAKRHGFKISMIVSKIYRGFTIYLEDLETEIAIGKPPFDDKFDHLIKILKKLAAQDTMASRIELDYHGKAFVKLKKI